MWPWQFPPALCLVTALAGNVLKKCEPETLGFSCSGVRRADAVGGAVVRAGNPAALVSSSRSLPGPRGGAVAVGVFCGFIAPGMGIGGRPGGLYC